MTNKNIKQAKAQLRKALREKRQALSEEQRLYTAKQISQQLRQLPFYKQAKNIGVYLAMPEEISLDSFIQHARADGKQLFVPVISKDSGNKRMLLQAWQEEDSLRANQYGISQPQMKTQIIGSREEDSALDMLILPLVGYNHKGSRLGMGGGYYDRYLDSLTKGNSTQRIGVAHSCQFSENIPTESWDMNMHFLVNEVETINFLGHVHTDLNYEIY